MVVVMVIGLMGLNVEFVFLLFETGDRAKGGFKCLISL